jgi:hypothetical protein
MMENVWQIEEHGTRRFHHGGWELIVWAHCPNQITVMCSKNEVEVEVCSEGIECFGERSCGGYGGFEGVRFTIPWRILTEIILFHSEHSK